MEVNAEKTVFKYSKFVEVNLKNDDETHLTMDQETMDKQKAEKLVVSWFDENNPTNAKNSNLKNGSKTLVGLTFAFLMVVAGLIAGLIILSMENQELDNGWENEKRTVSNLTKALDTQKQIAEELKIQNQDILKELKNLQQNHSKAKEEIDKLNLMNQNLKTEKDAIHEYFNHTMNSTTKLLEAAKHGDLEEMRLLLKLGLNSNVHDSRNMAPLHFASYNGFPEIAELLLQNGAMVNIKDNYGMMPLHKASMNGHLEIVKLLLQNGADVNARTRGKYTPLHLAAYYCHFEIVEFLVQTGAEINAVNNDNDTALRLAAYDGCHRIIEFLLKHGANKDLKNILDETPV